MKKKALSENAVDPDPFRQFDKWYREHLSIVKIHPDAVSLASSTLEGNVSVRTVLLKDYNGSGFVFFTNYNSKKGRQLSQNPNAAMLFYWPESGRQIRIEGIVEKISEEESRAYFRTRPRESQIGAWASEQSTEIPGRGYLEEKADHFSIEFSGRSVEKPINWGGYRLSPSNMEFWQEGQFRLHDRIIYNRTGHDWKISRLAP